MNLQPSMSNNSLKFHIKRTPPPSTPSKKAKPKQTNKQISRQVLIWLAKMGELTFGTFLRIFFYWSPTPICRRPCLTASSSGAWFFAWQRRARNASDCWWTARDHGKGTDVRRSSLSPSRLPLRAHFHRKRDVWVLGLSGNYTITRDTFTAGTWCGACDRTFPR